MGGGGNLNDEAVIILLGGRGSFDMSESVNIHLNEHMALIFHLQSQETSQMLKHKAKQQINQFN